MAKRITLQIEPWKSDEINPYRLTTLRVSWFETAIRGGPYWLVDVKQLEESSEQIKNKLNDLSDLCFEAQSRRSHTLRDKILLTLIELSNAGKRLYIDLFSPTEQRLRDYLSSNLFEIIVQVTPKLGHLIVPWGLIFDPRAKSSGTSWTIEELHNNFWCILRRLATVYQNVDAWRSDRTEQLESGLFSVLEKKELKKIKGNIEAWPHNNVYSDWESFCYSNLDNSENKDRVVHFFCHGIDDVLYLDDSPIEAKDFRYYMNQRPECIKEIPIFNACNSSFIACEEWLNAVWHKGCRGFIGVESKVPPKFAWDFGRDFIKSMLSNQLPPMPISNIIYALRIKHRPFGLLYGLYADPDVCFNGRINTDYIPEIPGLTASSYG